MLPSYKFQNNIIRTLPSITSENKPEFNFHDLCWFLLLCFLSKY